MIETLRHMSVFNPDNYEGLTIDIIGAGAAGSRVAISLAKLGLGKIQVWDFDKIESHNIANQAYGLSDISKSKVEALFELIKAQTGTEIEIHNERVDGSQKLGNIVFLLTDTMSSRKEIWGKALKFHPQVKLVIETRMGADNGRVYAVSPMRPGHIKAWESTLYSDQEAEVSACGASISVGPTAETLSGLAVWQMIRWLNIESGKETEDNLENEIIFSLNPMMIIGRKF